MIYIKGLDGYTDDARTAVTLGKFDGLHRGHQMLINQIRMYAKEHNVKSVVVAFDMAPLHQKLNITGRKLVTNDERRYLLEDKVDVLLECPFTDEIHDMKAEDFIRSILVDRLRAEYVVVGNDFRFGHGRQGNAAMLEEWAEQSGFRVEVIAKEKYHGREISSTYLKEVLPEDDIELANELLGYPYTIIGEVEHGNRIGRTLGIPTMNLRPGDGKMLPPFGVYECQVCLDEVWHNGICNIGVKPTIADHNSVSIECHLFEYEGDAYGKEIQVRLFHKERGEKKFSGVSELKAEMQRNIASGKEFFKRIK